MFDDPWWYYCSWQMDGEVDQSAGMLRDDVQDKGYTLLCIALPQSDAKVRVIEEEELLAEVMDA